MVRALYILSVVNLAITSACYGAISGSQPATMDGLGAALMIIASLVMSVVLTILGGPHAFRASRKGQFSWHMAAATVLAVAPLGIYFVTDVLPRISSR